MCLVCLCNLLVCLVVISRCKFVVQCVDILCSGFGCFICKYFVEVGCLFLCVWCELGMLLMVGDQCMMWLNMNWLLLMLIGIMFFGLKWLVRISFVIGFLIFCWIVCFSGCVLNIGLQLIFVICLSVVGDMLSVMFSFVSWLCRCVSWIFVIDLMLLWLSVWNMMMLLIWFRNLGWKCCFILSYMVFLILFCGELVMVWIICELRFDVIMMIVFLKLIVCFCLFVMWLLLSICSSMLNMFGFVFLILLSRIMLYGLWCMVFVRQLFFLQLIQLGGVLISCVMLCFFMNLFMLMWIRCFFELNRNDVSVLYSLVLLIFVGLRNRNELYGWFGLVRFVCD